LGPSSPKTYSTDWDGPTPSSTLLQKQLELPPLSTKRKIARITLLHKAIHEKVAIPIPSYIIKPTRTSRCHHPKRYIQIRPKKDVYKYSFFPRTFRDWNQLFGDEGPKCCWHTQGEVGQAQGMLVSLPPLDMILYFYVWSLVLYFLSLQLSELVCPKTWCSWVQLLGMDLMLLFLRFVRYRQWHHIQNSPICRW
jgi:hypothetical protein